MEDKSEQKYYEINEELAKRAKHSYSFSDYEKNSATNGYTNLLNEFTDKVNELKKDYAKNYETNKEYIDYLCDRYAFKLANAINRNNQIDCYCPSVMITGAGNFPTRKKEKQNDMQEKFWKECGNLFNSDNYILEKIRAILTNKVIYSNDEFAIEKLQEKLQEAIVLQEKMKNANAYYRKNKTMKDFEDLTDEQTCKIDKAINESWYKAPYAAFQLSNNNATIKNVKDRINELTTLKAKETEEYEAIEGLEVIENKELMRIQLLFEEKPSEEIRNILKSNGFKWAPSQNAWQRQLTSNGIYTTKMIIKNLKEGVENGR